MNTCLLKAFFGGGEQVVGAASLGGASAQLSRDLRWSAPAPAGRGPDDRDRRRRAGPGGECAGAADAAASGFPASSCAKTTTFQTRLFFHTEKLQLFKIGEDPGEESAFTQKV